MKEEKENKNIYQKLAVIQERILGLGKDKKAFNYKYVTGDKVLSAIKPIMVEQGLILKQEIVSIDNDVIKYTSKHGDAKPVNTDSDVIVIQKRIEDKTEVLSKVMMKFTWVDIETGEKDENSFGANGQNAFDKGVGSALTYAERYFLLKYFHIATDEDDIDQPVELPPFTPNLKMWSQAIEKGKTLDEMKEHYLFTEENEKKYTNDLITAGK